MQLHIHKNICTHAREASAKSADTASRSASGGAGKMCRASAHAVCACASALAIGSTCSELNR